jgi:cytochrome b subunit of formate dehydrogenase
MGWQFNWVDIHWVAGVVLTGSIIYHIIHATFWLDFWSIWVGPKDIPEFKAELLREAGHDVAGPYPAKYPIGNRLYHLVLVFVGCTSSLTGVVMLWRMGTPLFAPNPYILGEATWGWVYVLHGLVGLSLAGLTAAHVVFGVRPKNWWMTKSMIVGWLTRREYLEHHEPTRWRIKARKS